MLGHKCGDIPRKIASMVVIIDEPNPKIKGDEGYTYSYIYIFIYLFIYLYYTIIYIESVYIYIIVGMYQYIFLSTPHFSGGTVTFATSLLWVQRPKRST